MIAAAFQKLDDAAASGWDRAVRTVIERAKNGQAIQAWPGECREEGDAGEAQRIRFLPRTQPRPHLLKVLIVLFAGRAGGGGGCSAWSSHRLLCQRH